MNVLVIDDDQLVCASLKTIIEADDGISVIGLGYNGQAAIDLYKDLQPDILLMDIRMQEMTGLEAGEQIIKDNPAAKILYLTTFLDDEYIVKALKIGAKGYMVKQNFESIVPSLKAVAAGQTVFGSDIIVRIPELMGHEVQLKLSDFDSNEKDMEMIAHVAQGLSNREIAAILFLSEGTVRNRISLILEKLTLRDRTQLAIFYYKNGLDRIK
jgi:DNA-binding NarL/FixJ family response regulator